VVKIGEFLLARVDDDAFLAAHMLRRRGGVEHRAADIACLGAWDPEHVLASCAARRELVLHHRAGDPTLGTSPCDCGHPDSSRPPCHTLRALALEWRGHPDYQAEWRAHPVPRQAQSA
jgi:hypothetical protein